MDSRDIKHNEGLIRIHKRRLNLLKNQHATLGPHAPPHILMEIRDVEEQIKLLGGAISPYKADEIVRKAERVSTCPQCKAPIKLASRNRDDGAPFAVYSVRVDTSIECGYCGTIIPNQFAEEETVEGAKQDVIEEIKEVAVSSSKPAFAWLLRVFRGQKQQ